MKFRVGQFHTSVDRTRLAEHVTALGNASSTAPCVARGCCSATWLLFRAPLPVKAVQAPFMASVLYLPGYRSQEGSVNNREGTHYGSIDRIERRFGFWT